MWVVLKQYDRIKWRAKQLTENGGAMKIMETVARECCQWKDLKPYLGLATEAVKRDKPKFCMHCGQIWVDDWEIGPAGSMEATLRSLTVKE